MKILIYILLGYIILFLGNCETGDECGDNDLHLAEMYQADIYFNWNYCIVGSPDYAPDIGEGLLDKTIVITFYKLHCGGDLSTPMEYRYLVSKMESKK